MNNDLISRSALIADLSEIGFLPAIFAATERGKKVLTMDECKWCKDEICVNADCPMCCDYCPVPDTDGVCRFEKRGADNV